MKRTFILTTSLAVLLLIGLSVSSLAGERLTAKPNVIIVLADDVGYEE